jgi:uncharacterized membrane protein YkvA (DUF1232 family)
LDAGIHIAPACAVRYVVGFLIGLVALWIALLVALAILRPKGMRAGDAARLMPDLLRLIGRLARDKTLTRRLRGWLWFLLAFMVSPIDLIPDVIPVIGFADDVVIAYLVLRHVIRTAGPECIERNWPGTEAGLSSVWELLGGRPDSAKGD